MSIQLFGLRPVDLDVGAAIVATYFLMHRTGWPPFVVELNERGYFVPRPVEPQP